MHCIHVASDLAVFEQNSASLSPIPHARATSLHSRLHPRCERQQQGRDTRTAQGACLSPVPMLYRSACLPACRSNGQSHRRTAGRAAASRSRPVPRAHLLLGTPLARLLGTRGSHVCSPPQASEAVCAGTGRPAAGSAPAQRAAAACRGRSWTASRSRCAAWRSWSRP